MKAFLNEATIESDMVMEFASAREPVKN